MKRENIEKAAQLLQDLKTMKDARDEVADAKNALQGANAEKPVNVMMRYYDPSGRQRELWIQRVEVDLLADFIQASLTRHHLSIEHINEDIEALD
jgi:hypothetical protein